MYDVIVLGATFAAAGIAQTFRERCLIIERGTRAGYEFFGALNFGTETPKADLSSAALSLEKKLYQGPDGVYGSERHIYPLLQAAQVVFGAAVESVQKKDGHFSCRVFGVSGFVTYEAKRIVDTRCTEAFCHSKTYDLLIESDTAPAFPGVKAQKIVGKNHYVLFCPVPLPCNYPEARLSAFQVMRQFSDFQRLIISADEFDYQVQGEYPEKRDDILYLPSKAYRTPVLAFDAGLQIGGVL